jgi:glycosyltransferase involved in cell wall biosynthesis
MSDPRLVLTMIVKDEAHVIERCVESIRPLVDAWCIIDTGSTDGTQELIRGLLGDLPGVVLDVPWVDFAHNRTVALDAARTWGDYALMIDADVECIFDPRFEPQAFRRSLHADQYQVLFRDEALYRRPQLTSTNLPFSYRGPLHEYLLTPPDATDGGNINGFHYRSHPDGARSKNPRKYQDDAAVLERLIAAGGEPDLLPRYMFHLANTYRSAGDIVEAADRFRRRAELGGWDDEVYVSWLWHGRLLHELGQEFDDVLDAFTRATDSLATRAEAACDAAMLLRLAGDPKAGYRFARHAASIEQPDDWFFLEPDVYLWRAQFELSIAAYYVGAIDEGRAACQALLTNPELPAHERQLVHDNLRFYT